MGVWAYTVCNRESYYDNFTSPSVDVAVSKII